MKRINVMILHAPTDLAGVEGVILNMNRFIDPDTVRFHNCPFINFNRGRHRYVDALEKRGIAYEAIPLEKRFECRYVIETRRLIREKGIDIVHSHGYRADVTACLATWMSGPPVVSTIHGTITPDLSSHAWNVWAYVKAQKAVLPRIRALIPVSREIEIDLLGLGIPAERLFPMKNVVDLSSVVRKERTEVRAGLGLRNDTPLIVSAGRLSREKGTDLLIEACRLLKDRGRSFQAAIVGDGPQRAECEDDCRKKRLEADIHFLGFRENAKEILAAADVFVLPSRTEGIPLVLLEAMGLSRPVVAAAVGGVPEIVIHEENGLLVRPNAPGEIADSVAALFSDPDRAARIGGNAQRYIAENHDPVKWAGRLESLYLRVLRLNAA